MRISLIEQRRELVTQRVGAGRFRRDLTTGNLSAETGGDVQGLARLAKIHLIEVVLIQALEVTLRGQEQPLGDGILAIAEGLLAPGGIQAFLALGGRPHGRKLFGLPGHKVPDAPAPVEIGGPAFDGAEGDADPLPDGVAPAGRAEFEVNPEGLEGAGGFTARGREGGLSVGR